MNCFYFESKFERNLKQFFFGAERGEGGSWSGGGGD